MNFLEEILAPKIGSDVDTVDNLLELTHTFNSDFPDANLSIYSLKSKDYVLLNVKDTSKVKMHIPKDIVDEELAKKEFVLIAGKDEIPEELTTLAKKCDGIFMQRMELQDGTKILAIISLSICSDNQNIYDAVDSELTDILIARMLQRYINRRVHNQVKEGLSSALNEVKVIKEKLMPVEGYEIEGLTYAKHYAPCLAGGGDHYDLSDLIFAKLRTNKDYKGQFWGGSIVDVSGHGPAAAVEVAMLDAILRTYQPAPGENAGPAGVQSYINRHIFTRQLRGSYITAILFVYDSDSRIFSYSSAGHLPAIIKYKDPSKGADVLDQAIGIPLGIMREHEWDNAEAHMDKDDCLILYTDGITEAKNRSGKEFGMQGILDSLDNAHEQTPQAIVDAIVESLNNHKGTTDHVDDETILVLQPVL